MRRAGFTMVEMAIVVSILGVLVPLEFALLRTGLNDSRQANFRLTAAEQARDVSEALQLDSRTGKLAATGDRITFSGEGPCHPVDYQLSEQVLVREACGNRQALARQVSAMVRDAHTLKLEFTEQADEAPVTFIVALEPTP